MVKRNLVAAIDIGAFKICMAAAEIIPSENKFKIVGFTETSSNGIEKGVITDIKKLSEDIKIVIENMESKLHIKIKKIFVGISSFSINSIKTEVIMPFEEKKIIKDEDVEILETKAKDDILFIDKKILHKFSFDYKLDSADVIANPLGLKAAELKAKVIFLPAKLIEMNTVERIFGHMSIKIEEIISSSVAVSRALLSPAEREKGIIIADIGAENTIVSLSLYGKILFVANIPLGGKHITSDISSAFTLSFEDSEKLKIIYSTYFEECDKLNEKLGDKFVDINIEKLKMVIDCRIEEILENLLKTIRNCKFKGILNSGVKITGGGAKTAGLLTKASIFFKTDVFFAKPIDNKGFLKELIQPEYSVCIGTLIIGMEKHFIEDFYRKSEKKGLFSLFFR